MKPGWWNIARVMIDTILLLLMAFVPVKAGIIAGSCILILVALYALTVGTVHRCTSSNWIENILNVGLAIFSLFGILQVYGVRNALLVDTTLDYFLFALVGVGVLICIGLCLYYFIDGHVFGISESVAQKRAARSFE